MNNFSPMELLGQVVDEVEGLRRTDARSFLPLPLMLKLREAIESPNGPNFTPKRLTDVCELAGNSVEHVIDGGLKTGDVLILCSNGSFVVLEADSNGCGDDPYVTTSSYGGSSSLADYLEPRQMEEIGLINRAERMDAEHKQQIAKAEKTLQDAERRAAAAKAVLEQAKAKASA